MNQKIKISVIIPALNEEKYILTCLKSLAKQDFTDFEVIIVDNDSTDKTLSLVKNFKEIGNLIIIQEKERIIGKVRQVGFEKAQGEILISTDADTLFPKNWLRKINDYLDTHPKIIAVGGPYSFYDEGKIVKFFRRIITPIFIFIDKVLSEWQHNFAACNFAVRRGHFLQVGGFDKTLVFGEDIDLSVKLRKIGKAQFINSLLIMVSARRFKKNIPYAAAHNFFHYLKTIFRTKTKYK